MSVGEAIILLAAIWCIIHILHYLFHRKSSSSTLPSNSPRHPATKISLRNFQLRISTTKWNTHHDRLSTFLARRGKRTITPMLKLFYNLGCILGAAGMLVAVGGLVWMCGNSALVLSRKMLPSNIGQTSEAHHITKRTLESAQNLTPGRPASFASTFPGITPIIPGVTVPLGDLPIIILAVFLSQIVHELGHAIAAAREYVPMISAGVSFTVCIPAAFVSFPVSGMKNLSARGRSRVIAAGPFHNLVFWCFLVLVTRFELVDVISLVSGYRNVSYTGKVVVDVSKDSPLSLHISPGFIITKLDDTSLIANDQWTEYLTGMPKALTEGWCVARTVLEKSDACCALIGTKASPLSCFISLDNSERGCADAVPVLTNPNDIGRCTSSSDCAPESACVVPHKESQLMRITVRPSLIQTEEKVILWSGPFIEIWEEVQVGNWLPRFWPLPLWIPPLVSKFWEYLTMATLSLYFFNLLPLPHLDGTELLHSFLDLVEASQEAFMYDVEALEAGEGYQESTRRRQRWKKWIIKYVPILLTSILLSCILLSVMNIVF